MINKLRHKFVLVATVSVATMLLVVVLGATLFNYVDLNEKADNMVQLVVDNNGVLAKSADKQKPHDDLPREAMFNTRFFVVYLDSENNITSTDTVNIFAADSEMAQNYATEVIEKDSDSGFLNDYKYKATTVNNQNAIVFVDVSSDINMVKKFLVNGSLIALLSIILVAVISYVLSPIAIKPTIEAYEKQKKFITDASHEIKTPLTVISANLDIIEMDSGENKWTKSAKTQVSRLTELVNRLVSLSRMDEATSLDKEKFSLSELCEMVAESYDSIALSSNKEFRTELEENIYYTGSEKSFNQLCYILLDNAFKFAEGDGEILFSLSKTQDKIKLIVSNPVNSLPAGTHNELFDRFYRADESRNSSTGGFGIGLSLAKSIVQKHKGKITANSPDGISFVVEVCL